MQTSVIDEPESFIHDPDRDVYVVMYERVESKYKDPAMLEFKSSEDEDDDSSEEVSIVLSQPSACEKKRLY